MIQLVLTVTIGDGQVVNIETGRDLEWTATARDRLEAKRLEMVLKTRTQRFARRNRSEVQT